MSEKKSYARLGSRQRALVCMIDADTCHDDQKPHKEDEGVWCGPLDVRHNTIVLNDQHGRMFGEVHRPAYFSTSLDWIGPDDRKALDGLRKRGFIKKLRDIQGYPVFVTTEEGHIAADDLTVDEYEGIAFLRTYGIQDTHEEETGGEVNSMHATKDS